LSDEIRAIAERFLTKIKKSGPDNVMAVCPFHRRPDGSLEHNPSFTMSLTKGIYYCFSCHESGTLKKFLREMGVSRVRIEGEYKYILEEVERARPPKRSPLRKLEPTLEPLPEGLLGLFDYCPVDLVDDGFDEKMLARLDVGFDKDHRRITFPLRDWRGRLVGISGRTVEDERPRYKVYDTEYTKWGLSARETNKRALVWNIHNVQPAVYFDRSQSVVLVEGFKACMRVMQTGITNVLALLGSYMSPEQQWMIEALGAATVYVMLDNDDAGWGGRLAIGRALARALNDVRIVEYEAEQPSDLTTDEITDALRTATEYHLWKIQGRHIETASTA
jgi:DNA primase